MRRVFIISLVLMLGLGCSRYIESEDPGFTLPEEPPIPVSLVLNHQSEGVELSWQVSDTNAVEYFRVYYGTTDDESDLDEWDTTSNFSAGITGLNSGQAYFFTVSSVTPDDLEGGKAPIISTGIGVMSLTLNNDDSLTNSKNVTVTFVLPATAYLIQLSEDAAFADARWDNFSTTKSFILSDDDGLKRVYGRFRFSDGSGSTGDISDSITLDTHAHIDSAYFRPLSGSFEANDTLTFSLLSGESGGEASVSFPGINSLTLFDDGTGGDVTSGDGLYTREFVIPIDLEVADGVVTGSFRDAAGNNADNFTITSRLTVENPPLPVSLSAAAENSSTVRITWSASGDDDFAAYRLFRDTVWSVSHTSYQAAYIESRNTTTYTDNNLDDDRTYYYRIYVYDDNGLSTASDVVEVTTPVNEAPEAVVLAAQSDAGTVSLSWTENLDDDFESYRIYRSGTSGVDLADELIGVVNGQSTTTFDDTPGGPSHYKVFVFDGQGLSSGSNEVSGP